MRTGTAATRRAAGWWLCAALTASALLVSGCAASVDPDELPGTYRNAKTGAELVLQPDGRFSATAVSTDLNSDPADFSGRWEFLDDQASSDFIYLSIDGDGLRKVAGVQLYPVGRGAVEFRPDPDGKPLPKLTKTSAP
ncbi:hypothetical protein [Streptomyces antimicrobicus]|uniref:Lipoprotein n=1 Tax=Streptomyces antimicrobicus TaxID=2883108 RepID=A0ABS8B008_9ACTN|nr:hypothetical protein [Streptomyces antimicrobicus]MCB5177936.1 hypothetical protein [Streptomyces antimicrobicus]